MSLLSARQHWLAVAATFLALLALAGCGSSRARSSGSQALASNPNLDPGSRLSGRPAPDFTLTDQFGHRISLRSFRGKVVLLAFNDSECTTICPLTTSAMLDAEAMLGPAAAGVQLLGVDANPKATTVHDVLSYSELHGLTHAWHFLTGSLRHLTRVWRAYRIEHAIVSGQVDHTPALFVIDPSGRLRMLYLTTPSYAAVGQLGQLVAEEAASLLPGHPHVDARLSFAQIRGTPPTKTVTLQTASGGHLRLGPGGQPRLLVFFATWDREVGPLARQLESLRAYSARGLPALTLVDEASVEPSAGALPAFLRTLKRPLPFTIGLDRTGRVADGYEVQDQPWFVLVSAAGRIVWYRNAATAGWPQPAVLRRQVRAALARTPPVPGSVASVDRALAGSPPPLAALHAQAARLLTSGDLAAAIRALRGYPVVVNVWQSSCQPCRAEFGLLANASAAYGKRVAFLGADYNDSDGDAQAFLRTHWVSYPSYPVTNGGLDRYLPGGILGVPTTFFVSPTGRIVHVNTGQYVSQGSLDGDIASYALGR